MERFLAYLSSIERSPNTVKAYTHDLKDWFVFLNRREVDWRASRRSATPGCGTTRKARSRTGGRGRLARAGGAALSGS
ncbi:MAG: site-specific integrase [Actinomycetes bacterium]